MSLFLGGVLVAASACGDRHPGSDKEIDRKVESLLSQMTLDEKIGQINQVSPYGPVDSLAAGVRAGEAGSMLNEVDPERINALQKIAVEESRLGIPILFSRDVIHGFRTVMPIPLGLAATFDPDLVEEGARVAAREATANGIRWTFSPMLDISRDPRWGRIAESSGEDTYLTSVMAGAMVRGYQGTRYDDPESMAACAKHFVGYGAAEGGRDYNSTYLTERQLRNDYFPPFQAAIDNGALTLMTSFNDNDGIPSTGNKWLLTDVLRNEWGFDGMVVTDWNSAREMITHGYANDDKDAAEKSLAAGVDMDMMSFVFKRHLKELLDEGRITESMIDNAVRNVLRLKFRLGLFEHPYADTARMREVTYCDDHLETARRSAAASAVLLRNEKQVLPFGETIHRLMVAGPMADAAYDQLGTWCFDGEADHTVTPLAALRDLYGSRVQILYDDLLPYSRATTSGSRLAAFTAQARTCDAVVLFLGEEAILSGEAHCLTDLHLQGDQRALLAAARRSGKPVVTVVMAGRPLTVAEDLENTDALMWSFHPGTMGGTALAQLLFGDEVPAGRLPVTFPVSVGQIPIYYNHHMTGRPALGSETLLNDIPLHAGQTSLGCRSYYLDAGFGPLYPFGYGLTYTTFEYGKPVLEKEVFTADDTIRVSCEVTNTGSRRATETVQLYVRDMKGSLTRPVRELKGFERVALEPGESRTVEMSLPVADLAFWGADRVRRVEPGDFRLWMSHDSASGQYVEFKVQ